MFALDTVKMLSPLGRFFLVKLLPKRRFSKIFEEHLKKILDNLPFRLLHLRNSKLVSARTQFRTQSCISSVRATFLTVKCEDNTR